MRHVLVAEFLIVFLAVRDAFLDVDLGAAARKPSSVHRLEDQDQGRTYSMGRACVDLDNHFIDRGPEIDNRVGTRLHEVPIDKPQCVGVILPKACRDVVIEDRRRMLDLRRSSTQGASSMDNRPLTDTSFVEHVVALRHRPRLANIAHANRTHVCRLTFFA